MKDPTANELVSRNEFGASAVEYGLLIAGIATVIVLVVFTLGRVTGGLFEHTCNEFAAQPTVEADCD